MQPQRIMFLLSSNLIVFNLKIAASSTECRVFEQTQQITKREIIMDYEYEYNYN